MKEIIAVLYNIRSLYNVGSIFRTADGAGVKKIYLCGVTPKPFDRFGNLIPQFGKVSLGAEKSVGWDASVNSARATLKLLDGLKKEGYKIFAVEQSRRSKLYYKTVLKNKDKIVLILGNEVNGLPPSILKTASKILEIPMYGRKESLNVSVAFGVVVYRLVNSN